MRPEALYYIIISLGYTHIRPTCDAMRTLEHIYIYVYNIYLYFTYLQAVCVYLRAYACVFMDAGLKFS